jgi:hypothetical protein
VISLRAVSIKGHNSDEHLVISPGTVATKGHNNNGTVLKFSPTSPIRTHAHQLLNIRQSEGFKDRKQLVLDATPPGLHVACVQTSTGVRPRRDPVENFLLTVFFMLLSKRDMCLPINPTSLAQSGTDPHKYKGTLN